MKKSGSRTKISADEDDEGSNNFTVLILRMTFAMMDESASPYINNWSVWKYSALAVI
jgi:hypothetical protein